MCSNPFTVHFFEAFDEERQIIQRLLPEEIVAHFSQETIQESGIKDPPAPLLCIRTQSHVPTQWLPNLKGVLSRSTGVDHLSRPASVAGPLPVFGHLAEYCSRAVAEHAIVVAGALLRRLPKQCKHMSTFLRSGLTGQQMAGRHLVVLGVGRIGSEIAHLGQALSMKVAGCDPIHRHDWLVYLPLEEALSRAEVLVCAMELTPQNRNLLDYSKLISLPQGAMVVNVARGELIVLEDLLKLYNRAHLAGIGLDVFPDESVLATNLRGNASGQNYTDLSVFHELMRQDNIILTPHNAFNTEESLAMKVQETITELEHFHQTGQFHNTI